MELILINESKLKVMLTAADMSRYAITCDTIDYDNTETRRAFWNILDEAKHKTGFDAATDRVFIQVYPSRGGGCEMYVTKIMQTADSVEKHISCKVKKDTEIYRLDTFTALLEICRQLTLNGYHSKSSAYCDESRKVYYLILQDTTAYKFLTEYCRQCKSASIGLYIAEHCVELCDSNAVEKLAVLI